jgi:acetyl esterase/lipase
MSQELNRRHLLGGIAVAAGLAALPAEALQAQTDEVLPLWPGSPPGAPATLPTPKYDQRSKDPNFNDRWLTGVGQPSLTVRRAATPNGTAVMLVPGGGYGFLAIDNEGEEQARWLNAIGVTAFILRYRIPTEGWANRATVPLADAQRGIRLIRASAKRYGVDPAKVLAIGFSAGGHLTGSLATRHAERVYAPIDAADQLSARPDLAGLIYPVVSLSAPFTHGGSRDNLFGTGADPKALAAASVENRVTAETPPIFLTHASDDGLVPIANSIALYQAMLAAQRPAELHAFDQGGHGFGVRLPKTVPASAWPVLFAAYARRCGVLAG